MTKFQEMGEILVKGGGRMLSETAFVVHDSIQFGNWYWKRWKYTTVAFVGTNMVRKSLLFKKKEDDNPMNRWIGFVGYGLSGGVNSLGNGLLLGMFWPITLIVFSPYICWYREFPWTEDGKLNLAA